MIVGINPTTPTDWAGRQFADFAHHFRRYGSLVKNYEPAPIRTDPDGNPIEPFGLFAEARHFPSGAYQWSHQGSGELTWKDGAKNPFYENDLKSGRVEIAGDSGNVGAVVHGVTADDPFRGFTVRRVADGAALFAPEFVAFLRPFGVVRFMDWQGTNYNPAREWDDRAKPTGPQTDPGDAYRTDLRGRGVALEHCLTLAKQTGAAPWLCVPYRASENYVVQMAQFVREFYNDPGPVYLEFANEYWNGKFPARAALVADAKADPELSATDENARLFQYGAKRLRHAVRAFRAAGVNVVGVLCGQASTPWLARQGLEFLEGTKAVDGWAVKDTVGLLGFANYFLYNHELAGGLSAGLARTAAEIRAYRDLADQYGVPGLAAYEAGQHLDGPEAAKRAANESAEMGTVYAKALAQWETLAGPGSVWCAFAAPPAPWSASGYWGLAEWLDKPTPKLSAVLAAAGPPPPGPGAATTITVTIDGKAVFTYAGRSKVSVNVTPAQ